ncbi:unnamed protein product [Phytophthora lilii]|uniref:Unnamed protein product n=1 Tax=Phytophthora lilii TaxID=2077276 RepID=A0A9W6TER9_9STRA|nr:unnamed protein product [Phytophthora lilii]
MEISVGNGRCLDPMPNGTGAAVLRMVNADCTAGVSTITTEGCSGCGDFNLCLASYSADQCLSPGCRTGGGCSYECITVDRNSTTVVVVVDEDQHSRHGVVGEVNFGTFD